MILVGGASRRLGQNKTLVDVGGQMVLERLLAATEMASETVLAAGDVAVYVRTLRSLGWRRTNSEGDTGDVATLEDEHGRGLTIVCDPVPGRGPVAGLASGLSHVGEDVSVVLAGDLPFVSSSFVIAVTKELLRERKVDAVVPVARGRLQPLCAAYRRSVGEVANWLVAEREKSGERFPSMGDLMEVLRVSRVGEGTPARWGALDSLTRGIDSPDDLAWARSYAAS